MNITVYEGKTPFLFIENFYDEESLKNINKEINFFKDRFVDAKDTETARDKNGALLAKKEGIYLDGYYGAQSKSSSIIKSSRNFFTQPVFDALEKAHLFYNVFKRCNASKTLLAYYGDGDYYNTHADNSIISSVIWLFQEPKSFSGGEFYFEAADIELPCKNNTAILFFSCVRHGVKTIKLNNKDHPWSGRFSISNFYFIR